MNALYQDYTRKLIGVAVACQIACHHRQGLKTMGTEIGPGTHRPRNACLLDTLTHGRYPPGV